MNRGGAGGGFFSFSFGSVWRGCGTRGGGGGS